MKLAATLNLLLVVSHDRVIKRHLEEASQKSNLSIVLTA